MSKKVKREVDTRVGPEWESLDMEDSLGITERLKVAGGWLYRVVYERGAEGDVKPTIAMTFVPGIFKTEDSF